MNRLVRIIRSGMSTTIIGNNAMVRNARKLKNKLRSIHQTVGQAEKVQKLVKESKKQELAAKIQQTANYDKEFREFINDFNQKHRGRINLLDVSNYAREYKDLSKPGLAEHDLKILEEFRKRRLEIKARSYMASKNKQSADDEDFPLLLDSSDRDLESEDSDKQDEQNNLGSEEELDEEREGDAGQEINEEIADEIDNTMYRQGPFSIEDNFYILLIDRDTVTQVTTLNRIMRHRCLVFMANGAGIISYGRGKGESPDFALNNAMRHAKQNLIALPIDPNISVPQKLHERFQDYELTIRPCTYFNSWGHPVLATMLSLAGLVHCGFKTVHTDTSRYPMLNNFFKCVTKNTTPQQLAEKKGFKVYRHQWVRPYERDPSATRSYIK